MTRRGGLPLDATGGFHTSSATTLPEDQLPEGVAVPSVFVYRR